MKKIKIILFLILCNVVAVTAQNASTVTNTTGSMAPVVGTEPFYGCVSDNFVFDLSAIAPIDDFGGPCTAVAINSLTINMNCSTDSGGTVFLDIYCDGPICGVDQPVAFPTATPGDPNVDIFGPFDTAFGGSGLIALQQGELISVYISNLDCDGMQCAGEAPTLDFDVDFACATACAMTCADVAVDDCGAVVDDLATYPGPGMTAQTAFGGDGSGTGCQTFADLAAGTGDGIESLLSAPFTLCSEWTASSPDAFFPNFEGVITAQGATACFAQQTIQIFDSPACTPVAGPIVSQPAPPPGPGMPGIGGQVTGLTIGNTYIICTTYDYSNSTDVDGNPCVPDPAQVAAEICTEIVESGDPPPPSCSVDLTAPPGLVGCDPNDGMGFLIPLNLAACSGADGPVGTGQVFDVYVYTPGGSFAMAPAGYESTPIPVGAEFPDPFQDGNLTPAGADLTCADVLNDLNGINSNCLPLDLTFIYIPFDYTLDADGDTFAEYPQDCQPVRVDYTINPTLTAVIQSDASGTCGDVVAILQDANGNDCDGTEMTISCAALGNGAATDITLADNGCGPYNVSGGACAGCADMPPMCMLSNAGLSAGICTNPGTDDDPADDTFVLTINPTGTDMGTTYTYDIGAGPVAGNMYGTPVMITLPADGSAITVTITDDMDNLCTIAANVNAPGECSTTPPTTDIPTLSQWGLITLLLSLMSYGAIAMSGFGELAATLRRKEEEE